MTANRVITAEDVGSIYYLPIALHREQLDERVIEVLNIWSREPDLTAWEEVNARLQSPETQVDIAIVAPVVGIRYVKL